MSRPWSWMSMRAVRHAAGLAAAVLALWAAATAVQVRAEEGVAALRLERALAVEGDTPAFPLAGPTALRTLPDEWVFWRGTRPGPVWYRAAFDAPDAGADLLALYIERVCSTVEVHLNGQLLHRAGRLDEPITHNCNHPQLVELPAALLSAGRNVLDLKVAGYPITHVASRLRAGSLSALEIGPQAQLAMRHARQSTLNVALPQSISATLLLMGGFMFTLGWRNRRESYLAYFGALSIGWAIVEARLWVRNLPLASAAAEFLLCSLFAFVTLAAVQFLLRYGRWRSTWVDRALAAQCALMPATLVAAGPARLHVFASAWILLFALEVYAAMAFHLWLRRRARGHVPWSMAVLLGGIGLAIAVELLAQQFTVPSMLTTAAQLALPVVYVVVGLMLVEQHGRALQASEASRVNLEVRIRDATAEIERNFKQLSDLRVEQVTERERKRIAADLHDDLGAKLLTIVHTSEDQRIATLAREALEEMRLSVRGLTGKPVRLTDALGDWRAEVMSRLAQSGIEGEWSSPDEMPQTLSARAYVQTTRILREATSNIIKHSRASQCTFRCTIEEGYFTLVIQDNGAGIPMELDGRLDRGHGMASMKGRAKQMQGQCLVESGPGYGTVIRLTLPLDRAVEHGP